MMWLVLGVLVCLARLGEGGALRCAPGVQDPTCIAELEEGPEPELKQGRSCEPGTSWKSQCNDCACSPDGLPFCTDKACLALDSEPEKQCAPESRWKNECNRCFCTPNGIPSCTRKGCLSLAAAPVPYRPQTEEVPESDDEIDYDDYLEDDLRVPVIDNTNGDKLSFDYLTKTSDTDYHFDSDVYKTNQHLIQLERNIDDSETNVDGPVENHIQLNDDRDKSHNLLKRSQVCKATQVFQSECNQCKCASDGQSYTCTQNECMEGEMNKEVEVFMENEGEDHIERHSVCKPRGTFYIGCNTCHCNLYGTDYSCTNKPCPLPEDVELFHELKAVKSAKNNSQKIVCVAKRMFIKDCNTCWCNDDGTSFFCTRRVCVSELPEEDSEVKTEGLRIIKRECRPDEVFELDCNMCRCNPDGKSFSCTRRACLDQTDDDSQNTSVSRKKRGVTQEAAKACQPGQEFRMDCNKCLCDNLGQNFSCTRIDCNALNNNNGGVRTKRETSEKKEMECSPGSVFDRDCNVCRCSDDGHHATCTTKRCSIPTTQDNDVNSPVAESDPNFRCSPGEQFKRGCNDCSCSADGKSVFCTVRFCDQDITPPPSH